MGSQAPSAAEHRGQPSSQARRGAAVHDDLSQRLADLAREMQRQPDATAVLDLIVRTAVGTVPGVEEASISLVHSRRRVVSAASTSDLGRRFDELQEQTRQGPCMDSMYEHETVRVDDFAGDPRWPELGRRAAEIGVVSALCFQLYVEGNDLGALNLLARRPGAFTDESERVGLLFASHAAVALADAQRGKNFTTALTTRDVIGQAKGILMERHKITALEAFALLAKVSQDSNRKVQEIAEQLTATGSLDR